MYPALIYNNIYNYNNINRLVMEYYYESDPEKRGYRRRMHSLWMERGKFFVKERILMDQKRVILEKGQLTDLMIEETRRNIEANAELNISSNQQNREEEVWFISIDEDGRDVFLQQC